MQVNIQYLEQVSERNLDELIPSWRAENGTGGVFAMVAEAEKDHVPTLQQWFSRHKLALLGGIFPELIVEGEFKRNGVLMMWVDPMPEHRLVTGLSGEQGWAPAVEVLTRMIDSLPPDSTLMLIFDSMFGHVSSLLDDVFYEVGSHCHFAGINAGSETFQPMPCLFDETQLVGDGVLAFALPEHPGAVLAHGYQVPDEAIIATASANNRISRIGWQPGFEKYAELVQAHYGVQVTRENFYSMGVHFPFALHRGDGEVLIRIPVAVDDDGALFCVGEVPEGALLNVARAVQPGERDALDKVVQGCREIHSLESLSFYCAGRKMHLAAGAQAELSLWAEAIKPQPLMGAVTLGEIGNSPAGGYPLFHNATLVTVPVRFGEQK